MLDALQDRLTRVMKTLRGEGHLTEYHIDTALRELRLALLAASRTPCSSAGVTSASKRAVTRTACGSLSGITATVISMIAISKAKAKPKSEPRPGDDRLVPVANAILGPAICAEYHLNDDVAVGRAHLLSICLAEAHQGEHDEEPDQRPEAGTLGSPRGEDRCELAGEDLHRW